MRPKFTSQTGMSLVEATIILMVLALLTAVLAPSVMSYVDDARRVKAKEDVEAIGLGIARLLKDTGAPFLLRNGAAALASRYTKSNRVNILVGDGNVPTNGATVQSATTAVGNIDPGTTLSWTTAFDGGEVGSVYDHLVANNPGYVAPSSGLGSADPGFPASLGSYGMGWRGAYLSGAVGPDPWGFRYAVNSVYLGTASDASDSGEGGRAHGWSFDTIVVSAGNNNRVEVNFEDTISSSVGGGTSLDGAVTGDDIIYVISGYGR